MSEEFYSVEFAAERLKLHAKTVLRFIHEGRLRATKVGKQYRILRSDLEALAGAPPRAESPARATCIVDVPDIDAERARRLAAFLPAAVNPQRPRRQPLSLDVAHDVAGRQVKVVIVGAPSDAADVMALLQSWLEA